MTPGGPEWAGPSAASDVLALLEEENVALQVHALQLLDKHVHELWYQVSGYISTIEALSEDESFSHRELAALVASKVRGSVVSQLVEKSGAGACAPACLS